MKRAAITCAAIVLSLATARAESRNLPVPAATLYPGDAIELQSLQYKAFNGPAPIWRNYALDANALAGKFAKRTLVAGRPIALADIRTPDLVKRGGMVRSTFTSGGLQIATSLMPLQDGAAGDSIEARNMETGVTIHATVSSDGTLVIAAP